MADEIGVTQPGTDAAEGEKREKPRCGMIRPIADMGSYTATHWREVHEIVADAVSAAGYDLRLVSENDAISLIPSEIVTNIYNNEIVIADVSGRNPNVMFELGMRIAFQKPVVIITDDETPFSFDIAQIKHILYPRTLRFGKMNAFMADITKAITASVEAHRHGGGGYLQQFGKIEVTELGTQHIDANAIAESLVALQRTVNQVAKRIDETQPTSPRSRSSLIDLKTTIVGADERKRQEAEYDQVVFNVDQRYENGARAIIEATAFLTVTQVSALDGGRLAIIAKAPLGKIGDPIKQKVLADLHEIDLTAWAVLI